MGTMVAKTIIDAKGDIIAGTAADTAARLAVGTNGQVLKANSATATGLEWAADSAGMTNPMTTTGDTIYSSSGSTPARLGIGTTGQVLTVASGVPSWATPSAGGGGKVLQVVNASTNTNVSTSSASFSDTTLTATITPTSATSKVLVIVNQSGLTKTSSNASALLGLKLVRGATDLIIFEDTACYTGTAMALRVGGGGCNYLDSPATTSATTYKTQMNNNQAVGTVTTQVDAAYSTITLLEIGA
jgi:hypothetical protein